MRPARTTPGAIVLMAHAGLGVDDIRIKSGWDYRDIAIALIAERNDRLMPLARLAEKRAAAER